MSVKIHQQNTNQNRPKEKNTGKFFQISLCVCVARRLQWNFVCPSGSQLMDFQLTQLVGNENNK